MNRYKELNTLAKNLQKLIPIIEKSKEIASDTKIFIEEKTNIEEELAALLATTGQLATINKLSVNAPLEDLTGPCLPFDLDFVLNMAPPIAHKGNYDICFNGEFYQNLGAVMLRTSFPKVDDMYTALDEAEVRYVNINGTEKSLARAKKQMKEDSSSKRSHVHSHDHTAEDAIVSSLTRSAKRQLPKFTVKSDKTVMAFTHYSPWALTARHNPFDAVKLPKRFAVYSNKKINGNSS